jgi:nicotinate-nucleotide--dimethylbenzimidazole phosphoribosyltransferase
VTYQMVSNILQGGAAISVLARHGGIELRVIDAGVAADVPSHPQLLRRKIVRGSANLAMQPALTRAQAEQSLLVGLELAHQARSDGIALLGIGEMGIGNTTAASAITAVLTGCAPEAVTGRGTGVDDAGLAHKVAVITRALALHQLDRHQPVDILSAVGGAEIGVMMGIVLGAAVVHLPVVVDGFIATAAAALAVAQCPAVADYLFPGHQSAEPGHRALIDFMGHEPLLQLRLRLGEGTGAALAMHLIDAAAKLLTDMATFESAGVSKGPLA